MNKSLALGAASGAILAGITLIGFLTKQSAHSSSILGQVSQANRIYSALDFYAQNNDGQLPPGDSSNDVFRELIKAGIIESESAFADYLDGSRWLLIRRQDFTNLEKPLLFLVESPDMSTGSPLWHPERHGACEPGRTWPNNRIIVCSTDGSVTTWKTADGDQPTSRLESEDGKTIVDFAKLDYPLLPVE